jgi:hypothetical protein
MCHIDTLHNPPGFRMTASESEGLILIRQQKTPLPSPRSEKGAGKASIFAHRPIAPFAGQIPALPWTDERSGDANATALCIHMHRTCVEEV